MGFAQTFSSGEKEKVKGRIMSRRETCGKDSRREDGSFCDDQNHRHTKLFVTKIQVSFHRHDEMDVDRPPPPPPPPIGAWLDHQSRGHRQCEQPNWKRNKRYFSPDEFAIEVRSNNRLTPIGGGQRGTNYQQQGVAAAGTAQSSANNAQNNGRCSRSGGDCGRAVALRIRLRSDGEPARF